MNSDIKDEIKSKSPTDFEEHAQPNGLNINNNAGSTPHRGPAKVCGGKGSGCGLCL